ncbi:hypothetical protein D3C71_1823690 [compost metagenome]
MALWAPTNVYSWRVHCPESRSRASAVNRRPWSSDSTIRVSGRPFSRRSGRPNCRSAATLASQMMPAALTVKQASGTDWNSWRYWMREASSAC